MQVGPTLRLQEYGADGKLKDALGQLRRRGFDLGMTVRKGTSGSVFRIRGVSAAGQVELENCTAEKGAAGFDQVGHEEFLQAWVLCKEGSVLVAWDGWASATPKGSASYISFVLRGQVAWALHCAALACDADLGERILVFAKPHKMVKARAKLPKGSLVLVPETTAIQPASSDGVCAVVVQKANQDKKHVFGLGPMCKEGFAVPAWCVRTTGQLDKANMAWASCTVTSVGVVQFPKEVRQLVRLLCCTDASFPWDGVDG